MLICLLGCSLIFKDPGRIPLPRLSMPSEGSSDEDASPSSEVEIDSQLHKPFPHVSLTIEAHSNRESRRGPGRAVESNPNSPRTIPYSPPFPAIKLGPRTSRLSPLSTPPGFASPKHSLELTRDQRLFELPPRVSDELLGGTGSSELHRLGDTALRWGGSNLKGPSPGKNALDALMSEEDGMDTTPKPRPPYCHRCKVSLQGWTGRVKLQPRVPLRLRQK